MRTGRGQRGEGKVATIFWLLILVFGVIAGKEIIPIRIATMELKDHAEELCQLSPRGTGSQYRDSIYARAQELGLPVEKKHIDVKKTKQRAIIDISFPVTLNLLVIQHVWNVEIYIDRDIFLM